MDVSIAKPIGTESQNARKNPNHPKKGQRITLEPIRDEKDICRNKKS